MKEFLKEWEYKIAELFYITLMKLITIFLSS